MLLKTLIRFSMGTRSGAGRVVVNDSEGPPVPIPNTEVKLCRAYDTWLATARENRQTPTQTRPHLKRCGFCYASHRLATADGAVHLLGKSADANTKTRPHPKRCGFCYASSRQATADGAAHLLGKPADANTMRSEESDLFFVL